jgi:hypothetical protein
MSRPNGEVHRSSTRAILLRVMLPTVVLLVLTVPASAKNGPADVLGLHPGMSDSEVQHRLEKIGEVVRGMDRAKQTWKLRDPRYEYLVLRYDEDWRVHWVTAFAREGGRRVRYREVGDLSRATHTGQHFYTWTIPARSGAGMWTVVARGADPQYLDSISIESPMKQALIVLPAGKSEPRVEASDDD